MIRRPQNGHSRRSRHACHCHGIQEPFWQFQNDQRDASATRLTLPLSVQNSSAKVPTAQRPVVTVKGKHWQAPAHYSAP